jgi:hypothetical protein
MCTSGKPVPPLFAAIASIACIATFGCSAVHRGSNAQGALSPVWVPADELHPSIRSRMGLKSGDFVEGCGRIVADGRKMRVGPNGERKISEPQIEDYITEYFDNRTGKRIDTCEFVRAVRLEHQKENCPPREWKCAL